MNSVIPRCYSAHPFIVLQYSVIVAVMLDHFSELSRYSCYSAQSFFIDLHRLIIFFYSSQSLLL
jgi:hypothetical protein